MADVHAAEAFDLPLSQSCFIDYDHRLNSRPSIPGAIEAVAAQTRDLRPDFHGINCSHSLEFDPAFEPQIGSVASAVCGRTLV